jgi:hypothetical protein
MYKLESYLQNCCLNSWVLGPAACQCFHSLKLKHRSWMYNSTISTTQIIDRKVQQFEFWLNKNLCAFNDDFMLFWSDTLTSQLALCVIYLLSTEGIEISNKVDIFPREVAGIDSPSVLVLWGVPDKLLALRIGSALVIVKA